MGAKSENPVGLGAVLSEKFPGVFFPANDDDDDVALEAPSPVGDPATTLRVSTFFDDVVVGLGGFAHRHFDAADQESWLAFIELLLSDKIASFDALDEDGVLLYSTWSDGGDPRLDALRILADDPSVSVVEIVSHAGGLNASLSRRPGT